MKFKKAFIYKPSVNYCKKISNSNYTTNEKVEIWETNLKGIVEKTKPRIERNAGICCVSTLYSSLCVCVWRDRCYFLSNSTLPFVGFKWNNWNLDQCFSKVCLFSSHLGTCLLKTHVSFRLEPSAYEYGIYFQENWTDSITKVSSLNFFLFIFFKSYVSDWVE